MQARENGFEFRRWFRAHTARPWTTPTDAVDWLAQGDRSHMLLFSHGFVRCFFHEGERIRFIQPALAYQRVGPDGTIRSVHRRAHTRQSAREDVWQYHVREMAAADDPLRYIRRYLLLEETMLEAQLSTPKTRQNSKKASVPEPSQARAAQSDAPRAQPATAQQQPEDSDDVPPDYDDELLVRD